MSRRTRTSRYNHWEEVDYQAFRFRAVVDFILVKVHLRRPSNGWSIRKQLNITHAKPVDAAAGSAATGFEIRIDDPARWSDVHRTLNVVKTSHGFASPPQLVKIEVAFDAYHREHDQEALLAMAHRFFAMSTRVSHVNTRWYKLKGMSGSPYADPDRLRSKLSAGFGIAIGNRHDPSSQRIYFKRTDRAGKTLLAASEVRARSEVTLAHADLPISDMSRVSEIRFQALSDWFRYRVVRPDAFDGSALSALLVAETPQLGERYRRRNRRLFDSRTRADTQLNTHARAALQGLTERMNRSPGHTRPST